jgi:multisubunit Na+/H+ antiporter MnhE subunit
VRREVVGSIVLTVALALAWLGFVVEVINGHVVIGTLSAVLVVGAGVDYYRFRTQPKSPKNADLVHRLVFYLAVLALMHSTGLDTVEAWITGD